MSENDQENSGNAKKSGVNDDLATKGKPLGKHMRVPVPREKQQLEDKHTHCPYGWRATKKWKEFLSENQLNLEK